MIFPDFGSSGVKIINFRIFCVHLGDFSVKIREEGLRATSQSDFEILRQ